MRFFFRSRKFKILASVLAALIVVATVLIIAGETASPEGGIINSLISPFRAGFNAVADGVTRFFESFTRYDDVTRENEALRAENASLVSELMENQKAIEENEFFKKYLEIKEKNNDFIMEPATVVSRDSSDPYGSFTLNRGSTDGVALYDPVMTDSGLVGYVTELGLSYAKVTTLLDSGIRVAALDRRTGEIGVIGGDISLAADGKTRMFNINRSAGAAVGDYIVTSGGGVFPEGLVIGRITAVSADTANMSLVAEVAPAVDCTEIEKVMILTYFAGQGASK